MAGLGSWYAEAYERGASGVIAGLHAQEANLLCACELGRRHGWWSAVGNALRGLETLYTHTGRQEDWTNLLRQTVPDPAAEPAPPSSNPLPATSETRSTSEPRPPGRG